MGESASWVRASWLHARWSATLVNAAMAASRRCCSTEQVHFYGNCVNSACVLNVGMQAMPHLPEHIGQLKALELLIARENLLTSLPADVGSLVNLKVLSCENNLIGSIPEGIVQMNHLESIFINFNALTIVPDAFGQLTALRNATLQVNRITSIPLAMGKCSSLEYLSLSTNRLSTLPPTFGNLTKLATLNCDNNCLESLPDEMGCMTSLKELNVSANELTALKNVLAKLRRLERLTVTDNYLSMLPSEMSHMEHLQVLYAENNNLSDLPSSLACLAALKLLNALDNDIIPQAGNQFGASCRTMLGTGLYTTWARTTNLQTPLSPCPRLEHRDVARAHDRPSGMQGVLRRKNSLVLSISKQRYDTAPVHDVLISGPKPVKSTATDGAATAAAATSSDAKCSSAPSSSKDAKNSSERGGAEAKFFRNQDCDSALARAIAPENASAPKVVPEPTVVPAPTVAFVSLGYNCHSAMALSQHKMRYFGGPFDWLIASMDFLLDTFASEFRHFCDVEATPVGNFNAYSFAKYPHDDFQSSKAEEIAKYQRRIERLTGMLRDGTTTVVFVRLALSRNDCDKMPILDEVIACFYPRAKCRFLLFTNDTEYEVCKGRVVIAPRRDMYRESFLRSHA